MAEAIKEERKAGDLGKKYVCVCARDKKESGLVATSNLSCVCMRKAGYKKYLKPACMNDEVKQTKAAAATQIEEKTNVKRRNDSVRTTNTYAQTSNIATARPLSFLLHIIIITI